MTTAAAPVSNEVRLPKPIELRAEVDSLEALQDERRNLIKVYAPLAAKFKGGAIAGSDAARKRHRALIAKKILVELRQEADKKGKEFKEPSEAALERMANAHTDHIDFCDKLEQDFVKFIVLENDISELNERIRSREVEMNAYNAEIRMAR